jgi:hypothetical protein
MPKRQLPPLTACILFDKQKTAVTMKPERSVRWATRIMSQLGKLGLSISSFGVVLASLPMLLAGCASSQPLTAPLPLEPGSVLKQTFHVRTPGRYVVEVECKPIGPMKEMAEKFFNTGQESHVVCDISARILRSGIILKSEDYKFLEPSGIIGHEKILLWDLLWADLPSAGSYELEIENRSGLKSWQLAEPMVEVYFCPPQ